MTTIILVLLIICVIFICYFGIKINSFINDFARDVENGVDDKDIEQIQKFIVNPITRDIQDIIKLNAILDTKICKVLKEANDINAKINNFTESNNNKYKCWFENIQEIRKVVDSNNNLIKENYNKLNEGQNYILGDITTNNNLIKEIKDITKLNKSKAKNSSNKKMNISHKEVKETKKDS